MAHVRFPSLAGSTSKQGGGTSAAPAGPPRPCTPHPSHSILTRPAPLTPPAAPAGLGFGDEDADDCPESPVERACRAMRASDFRMEEGADADRCLSSFTRLTRRAGRTILSWVTPLYDPSRAGGSGGQGAWEAARVG